MTRTAASRIAVYLHPRMMHKFSLVFLVHLAGS